VAYVPEYLIELVPNETEHNLEFRAGRFLFWVFAVFASNWPRYAAGERFRGIEEIYASMLRKQFLRGMVSLLRHGKMRLLRERISTWMDASDPLLRALGTTFGRRSWLPDWYDPTWWSRIELRSASAGIYRSAMNSSARQASLPQRQR
jgi:hypothetical protein